MVGKMLLLFLPHRRPLMIQILSNKKTQIKINTSLAVNTTIDSHDCSSL